MIMYNSETNRLEEVKTEWKPIATEEVVRDISKKDNIHMTRFEKLKKLVETDNKKAIAEMLAIIANEDSPNDYTKFIPEWLEYLDEEIPVPTSVDEAYERGLNDAWECAKKIYGMNKDTRMLALVFNNYELVFDNYSASEAIEKIKEYEERRIIK